MDAAERVLLDPHERRVIGTLIEKGLTTPQSYPLSLNALATGCNQRNNRDPITNYTEEQLEEVLARLQSRNLVSVLHPATGRVLRYRQEFGRNFELRRADLAVLGELLLRGAQTEGELRQRASRMENVATLEDLHAILDALRTRTPPFAVRITPEGVARGVVWSHACADPAEIEQLRERERSGAALGAAADAAPASTSTTSRHDAIQQRIDELEARVARLEQLARGAGSHDA